MGVSWFGPSPSRIARVAVNPSITGMFTSMMIRSKRCSPAASMPVWPFSAVAETWPAEPSQACRIMRLTG